MFSDTNHGGKAMEQQDELYAEKANRDARAKQLKADGCHVRRGSIRGQLLHPQYVEDRKQGLSDAERGFGNTIHKTHWPVLYRVVWTEPGGYHCGVCGKPMNVVNWLVSTVCKRCADRAVKKAAGRQAP
jgi:hypothetical protein